MDNILFSASVILPLLLIMASGKFARRLGLMDAEFIKKGDNLAFRVFLPISLCHNIISTPKNAAIDGGAYLYISLGTVAVFLLLFLIIPRIERERRKIGVLIQCVGRSNYAYFGLPLVAMLFPGQDVSLASMLVACLIPVYNVFSVMALQMYGESRRTAKQIALSVLRNPLIIGTVIGLIVWLSGVTLPGFLMKTLSTMGAAASPMALFFLGAGIDFTVLKRSGRAFTVGVVGRLLVCPALMLALGALCGFRGVALGCALIAFGSPTAVSGYPMARQLGGDVELAGALVAGTTVFSVLSTFLFIFALKTLALI